MATNTYLRNKVEKTGETIESPLVKRRTQMKGSVAPRTVKKTDKTRKISGGR